MRLLISIASVVVLLVAPLSAQWKTSSSVDEMTGERSCYAHSPRVKPTETMGFPHNDVRAWLGFGTDGSSEWAYIGFSTAPNLVDTDIKDGYNKIRTRIKWDDDIRTTTLTQDWGASFLRFRHDDIVIGMIIESNTVLLELSWYGEGKTYFRFPLGGSAAAIAKARAACK